MRRRCRAPILLAALLACRTSATPGPPAAAPEPEVVAPDPEVAAAPAPTGDRDADGIPDGQDRCPDEPEDLDRFEDEDGCVDRDNDGDKILDAHEFNNGRWTNCDYRHENGVDIDCRDLPEDFDGDGDHDGCPDHLLNNDCQVKISERIPLDSRGRLIGDAPRSSTVSPRNSTPSRASGYGSRAISTDSATARPPNRSPSAQRRQ